MTTYNVTGLFGKATPFSFVLTEDELSTMREDARYRIDTVEDHTPIIRYKTCEGCERCTTDPYVPHYNCKCGANRAHCTSDYCY